MGDLGKNISAGSRIVAQRYSDGSRISGKVISVANTIHVCSFDTPLEADEKLLMRVRTDPPQMYVAKVEHARRTDNVQLQLLTHPKVYDARNDRRHPGMGLAASLMFRGMCLLGSVHDFSKEGISIETTQRIEPGTEVDIMLMEAGTRVSAVARHSHPSDSGGHLVGFRFDLDDRTACQMLVQSLQLTSVA